MRFAAVILSAFALLALGAPSRSADRLGEGDIALGANAEAQACRASPRFDSAGGVKAYDIFCGEWERPSGQITLFPAKAAVRADQALSDICTGEARPLAASGFDQASQVACASQTPGASRYALVARRKGQAVVGYGYPADWAPLMAAARVLAGLDKAQAAREVRGDTPGLREIAAIYPAGVPGQTAEVNYELLRRRAYEHNLMWSFAASERDFQELLVAHRATAPNDIAGEGDILAEIGLNLSGARRFLEAQDVFDQAEAKARQADAPLLLRKIGNYRALDLLNRRKNAEALALALKVRAATLAAPLAAPLAAGGAPGRGADISVADAGRVEARAAGQARRNLLLPPLNEATPEQKASVLAAQSSYIAGVAALNLGQADAGDYLADAQARLETVGAPPAGLASQIAEQRASWLLSRRDPAGALAAAQRGLELVGRTAPGTRAEGHLWLTLARVDRALGRPQVALEDGRRAVAVFARQLEQPGMPADVAAPHLQGLLDAWTAAPSPALAAEYFETLAMVWDGPAARSAAQLAARLVLKEGGAQARAFQDAERAYRASLTRQQRVRANPDANPADVDKAQLSTRQAAAAYDAAEVALRGAAPRYLELLSPRVDTAALQAALQPKEAYLRVVVGSSAAYGAVVTREAVTPVRLDLPQARAEALAVRLQKSVGLTKGGAQRDYDIEAAQALYQAVLAPLEPALAGVERLQLDVAGPLAEAPFAALVDRAPDAKVLKAVDSGDYRGVSFIGRRVAFAQALGPAVFVRLRTTAAAPPADGKLTAALYGDFRPDPAAVSARLAKDRGLTEACRGQVQRQLAGLPALEDSGAEVAAVQAAFGGQARVRTGAAFTDDDFMTSEEVSNADVLLLSTHGVLELSGCFSEPALLTSLGPDGGLGVIEASRLLERRLSARLVVLSACDTAKGARADAGRTGLVDGDGAEALNGLARGFIYAGATNVLATQWKVDSRSAAEQVSALLTLARRGEPLSQALQREQVALQGQAETSHPFFWAPFILIGDGGARLAAVA
jgi:CHAT domain-containing protein